MNRNVWRENIINILSDISDESLQMKAWIKGEGYCATPDEMYCMLFDDYSIELFVEDNFVALNHEQKSSAKKLITLMNLYSDVCGVSMNPSDVISNASWEEIRVQAKDFFDTLTKFKK